MGSDQKQPRRSYIAPTPAPSPMGSPFLGRVAEDVCGSETETKVRKVSKMIVCQIKCVENNEIIVNLYNSKHFRYGTHKYSVVIPLFPLSVFTPKVTLKLM